MGGEEARNQREEKVEKEKEGTKECEKAENALKTTGTAAENAKIWDKCEKQADRGARGEVELL